MKKPYYKMLLLISLVLISNIILAQSQNLGFEGQSFGTSSWAEDGINWTLGSWANIRSYDAHTGSNSAMFLSNNYLTSEHNLNVLSLWILVYDDMFSNYNTYVDFKGFDSNGNLVTTQRYNPDDMYSYEWVQINLSGFSNVKKLVVSYDDNSGMGMVAVEIDDISFQDLGAMPVELASFNANVHNNKIELNWQMATEVNNYGFEVERSSVNGNKSSVNWEKVGFVNGHGNSNSIKEYSFIDKAVTTGNYFYKLKQIDNDGNYEYSKIVEVSFMKPTGFSLGQNYPNPFNPATTIKFSLPIDSKVVLEVYNEVGQKVAELVNAQMPAGNHEVNFYASKLSSGIYIYRLNAGTQTATKKMIILK